MLRPELHRPGARHVGGVRERAEEVDDLPPRSWSREPDVERVVSHRGRFQIVEKVQEAMRQTVIRLDPRRRPAPTES
jgi:hypothetical protein